MTRLVLITIAAVVAALAFSATAMAQAAFAPRLIVNQDNYQPSAASGSTEIRVRAQREENSIAKITIYAPTGYTATLGQAAGTDIGTAEAQVQAREIGENAILDITGVVRIGDATNSTLQQQALACTGRTQHGAIWLLALQAAGTPLTVPVFVNAASGAETAFSAYKIELCFPSPEIPSSQGGAAFGAKILDATLDLSRIFTNPGQRSRYTWRGVFTPYVPNTGTPNPAGTVESRGIVSIPTTLTLTARHNPKNNTYVLTGTLLEATTSGQQAASAGAPILILGGPTTRNVRVRGTARTNRRGVYTFSRRLTPRRATFFIAARGELEIEAAGGCGAPQILPVPCVTATLNDVFSPVRRLVPRRR